MSGPNTGVLAEAGDVPAPLRAIVHSAIGAIPGCRLIGMAAAVRHGRNPMLAETQTPTSWVVHLEGWGPSLHLAEMHWPLVAAGPKHKWRGVRACVSFGNHLERQTARAEAAIAMGCSTPLAAHDRPVVRHLTVDRSAIGLMLQRTIEHGGSLEGLIVDRLSQGVADILRFSSSTRDGGFMYMDDGDVRVLRFTNRGVAYADVAVDVANGRAKRTVSGIGAVTMRGRQLTFAETTIPDVTAAALRERHLRDLIEIDPLLDDRIIDRVFDDDGDLVVWLTPDDVRVCDMK